MFKKIISIISFCALSFSLQAETFDDLIKKSLESNVRTEIEKERDKNRKPLETLNFFGIKSDMRVLELIPGGGWYTKILAPVVAKEGEYYVALGTKRIKENLLSQDGFSKVKVLSEKSEFSFNSEESLYDLSNIELDAKSLDAVLTFRNYHNLSSQSRTDLNKAVFKVLKPGGIYGVVDHTRRHMQKTNDENGRRFDPVLAIKEIQAAGFEFIDYSDLHYRADDELRYEVGRKTVTGNTDRFTLLFKKTKK